MPLRTILALSRSRWSALGGTSRFERFPILFEPLPPFVYTVLGAGLRTKLGQVWDCFGDKSPIDLGNVPLLLFLLFIRFRYASIMKSILSAYSRDILVLSGFLAQQNPAIQSEAFRWEPCFQERPYPLFQLRLGSNFAAYSD